MLMRDGGPGGKKKEDEARHIIQNGTQDQCGSWEISKNVKGKKLCKGPDLVCTRGGVKGHMKKRAAASDGDAGQSGTRTTGPSKGERVV